MDNENALASGRANLRGMRSGGRAGRGLTVAALLIAREITYGDLGTRPRYLARLDQLGPSLHVPRKAGHAGAWSTATRYALPVQRPTA